MATLDYFTTQLTGSKCAPYNCAAASGAMGMAAGSANLVRITADEFRKRANVSCVPGVHSDSGGLFISDVVRVFKSYGLTIDYGQTRLGYTRWSAPTLALKCKNGFGAVVLGDYDALPIAYRASRTFLGTHSAWVHDFNDEKMDICWHDPLRLHPIRIPISAVVSYWQKATSPVRGYAGFVKVIPPLPDTDTDMDTYTLTEKFISGVGTFTIAANTEVVGFKFDPMTGTIGPRKTWTPRPEHSIGHFDAYMETTATRGDPFLRCVDGYFEGYYIAASQVSYTEPAGAQDVQHVVGLTVDGVVKHTEKV